MKREEPPNASPRRPRRLWGLDGIVITIVFGLVLIGCWEAFVRLFAIPMYIIPPPSSIAFQFGRNYRRIFEYTLVTSGETLSGFAAAIVFGIPLALLIAFSPFLRRTLYPLAVTVEMIPKIVFAPVFVTWFGFGFAPKILIVFLVCFFPILLNSILAFTSLAVDLHRFCLSTGAGPITTFFKVRLPAALPQLFVGLKGAAVNATVGAVISEWIGGDAGLGYYIQIATGDLRMDLAFAVIAMLASIGLGLFGLVQLVERWQIPWHVSQRRVETDDI
jgi:NitT/TauT family transport system permease protein